MDNRILQDLIRDTKAEYDQELKEIQEWFLNNDWKPNKVVVGEWNKTDQRWLEYKAERAAKRARQDELNTLLEGIP